MYFHSLLSMVSTCSFAFAAPSSPDVQPLTGVPVGGPMGTATTTIYDDYNGLRNISYYISNGYVVTELDIIYGNETTLREAEAQAQAVMASGMQLDKRGFMLHQPWPDATIDYYFPTPKARQSLAAKFKKATKIWQQHVPYLKFNDLANRYHEGALSVNVGSVCLTPVGYQQGRSSFMILGPGCTVGDIAHEIGHVLGLYHEHMRPDRDDFIEIDWANIDRAYAWAYDKGPAIGGAVSVTKDYDYNSIMHYRSDVGSKNGLPVMRGKQGQVIPVENGQAPSPGDVAAVFTLYSSFCK